MKVFVRLVFERLIPFFLVFLPPTTFYAKSQDAEPPVNLSISYNDVKSATSSRNRFSFAEGNALALYSFQSPTADTGIRIGIGSMRTKMHWIALNHFKTKHFNNLLLSLGGYAKGVKNWVWDANVTFQSNSAHFAKSQYLFANGILHGRYVWNKKVALHLGITGTTGMHYTQILPLVGIDYKHGSWLCNLVFPINISIFYSFNDHLSTGVALRSLFSRQRLDKNDHLSRGLIAYTNFGVEFAIKYKLTQMIEADIHVGQTFGGNVEVNNRNNQHSRSYTLSSVPYFGLFLQYCF